MQLGNIRLTTISGGRFRVDGGTIFGVVPKSLWARVFPPDEENLIAQATNCLLVETGKHRVLIDTGYGSKLSAPQRANYRAEPDDPLLSSLAQHGLVPPEIDTLILSHLHFDHAGGATRLEESGKVVPTFANAEVVVQRGEWEIATADLPELRAAYPLENLHPLEAAGCLRFVDGNVEIVPGIRAQVTGGHTRDHMALLIESHGATAVYLADLCPTTRHFRPNWCMSYDVDLLETRRRKPMWLGQIADAGWLALFDHDPDIAACRLHRDGPSGFSVAEAIVEL